MPPTAFIIAGPNGAGKTTFAREFLAGEGCRVFINADEIAAEMNRAAPASVAVAAGRRFGRGWENFQRSYRAAVDAWIVFDNSGDEAILLEEGP